MIKDFQKWHNKKSIIHHEKMRPFFHEREVWFCSFGANVGFEQDGQGERFMRPLLVIRKFNNEIFWALPLTKHSKKGKYYFQAEVSKSEIKSTIILSQMRLLDAKRLQYKIGDISKDDFLKIKECLRALLE